ncbi:MAG: pyrroline-5-carboxylate reductase [Pirellulales bacterium]
MPADLPPTLRIAFVGAGQMATALARGFLRAGLLATDRLQACDALPAAAERFATATGGRTFATNQQATNGADVVILAVKPQHLPGVLDELRGKLNDKQLVISIAAGVRLETIAARLGSGPRLVRVMPNTPCLIGAGACAYALGPGATSDDDHLVRTLLEAVGVAVCVSETSLDAVTGLSGSGPAFVYLMIEALADGGVRMGLARDVALSLAAQTVHGASGMVLTTGQHPAVLKDQVTSPGGTTIAGLQALENGGLRASLIAAIEAATRRAAELSSVQ